MKAVAEATINELKGRLAGRDQALAELQALLESTKEQWLAQHQTDREEISRLNQALFERNNVSIDNLKVGAAIAFVLVYVMRLLYMKEDVLIALIVLI